MARRHSTDILRLSAGSDYRSGRCHDAMYDASNEFTMLLWFWRVLEIASERKMEQRAWFVGCRSENVAPSHRCLASDKSPERRCLLAMLRI